MTNATPAAQEPAVSPSVARAEAARYALLRRLAPSMRHHLVVNLQPIGMIYEVMDRRLRAPTPDLASVHDSAHKINGFARAALDSCLDVVTWLAPDQTATTPVSDGVRECVGLLATSLGFRGYAIRNEVGDLPGAVSRASLRNVLTSSLVHLTDQHPPPADVVLTASAEAQGLRVTLMLRPTDGSQGFANEAGYRKLEWGDVQALADAESIQVQRDGQALRMVVPWTTPRARDAG
ncbi:hypothetical protein ACFPOE_22870 [Caenimonas terrae]|uniref:HAMP domain-containing histidine kinase n=1 Tax=Caenimonas terrae TaxID=696074 RepID=A0ABW0NKB3_9BURK